MTSFFSTTLSLGSFPLFFFYGQVLDAQGGKFGVQGILQKSSGAELDDGNYFINFRLCNAEQGKTVLWTEAKSNVMITNDINKVALGSVTSLSLPFNEDYHIGVKVSLNSEMSPRAKLTIELYARSLKGKSNLFLSKGRVGVGTVTPNSSYLLHLKNNSGVASKQFEGTTGAHLSLKKNNYMSLMGYEASDNNFKLDVGTILMKCVKQT